MRFKKDTLVEVGLPEGMWRPATILSGNSDSYLVRYCLFTSDSGIPSEERVPSKALRPLQGMIGGFIDWLPGDVAEVYNDGSWIPAEVVREFHDKGRELFIVRLCGSSLLLRVTRGYLRLRRLWKDDKWSLISKASRKCRTRSSSSQQEGSKRTMLRINDQEDFEGPVLDTCSGTKRKSSVLRPITREWNSFTKKRRVIDRDGKCRHTGSGFPLHLMRKVDTVVAPCSMGEKYVRSSLGYADMHVGSSARQLANSSALDNYDTESMPSSVGSCSPHSCPSTPSYDSLGRQSQANGSPHSAKDVLDAERHLLELHAYRATLVALHASGPISWEQEAIITNLRLMLNISTDEHLAELRNLLSSFPSR